MLPRSLINVDLNAKPNSHSHFLKVNIREGNGPREIKAEVKEEILCSEDTNYEPTSSTCFKTIQNTPVYKASSITFKEEIMEDEYVPESDDLKTISVYKASSIEKTKSSDSHETYDPQGKPGNNNDEEIPASPPYTYKPSVKLNQNKNDDYVPQATEASKEVGVSYRARAIMRGSQDEENISNEQLYSPKSTPADSTGVFKAKRNFFRYAPSAIDEPDVEEKPKTPDSNKRTTRSKAKVSKANSAASLVEVKAQILRNFELFGEDSDTEEVRQSDTQIKRQKINERGKSKDKTDKFEELKSERERRRLKSKTEDNREIAPTDTKSDFLLH